MKFFIDTASIKEIREAADMGILDGVTTNPSLMAKEGGSRGFKEAIVEICDVVRGPVSVEVVSTEKAGMIREADEFASWSKHVVVKLPTTKEGLQACKELAGRGINTNLTLCFSANQALMVAKAGATYVSPFLGRLDDIGQIGMDLIKQIVQIYRTYKFETKVLAASLRHPLHVIDAALAGADVATIPFKVLDQMIKHPLTDKGLDAFLKDWEKVRATFEKEPVGVK